MELCPLEKKHKSCRGGVKTAVSRCASAMTSSRCVCWCVRGGQEQRVVLFLRQIGSECSDIFEEGSHPKNFIFLKIYSGCSCGVKSSYASGRGVGATFGGNTRAVADN